MFTSEFSARVALEELTGIKDEAEICREHRLPPGVFARWGEGFLEQSPESSAIRSSISVFH
jgi:hypothetical protein